MCMCMCVCKQKTNKQTNHAQVSERTSANSSPAMAFGTKPTKYDVTAKTTLGVKPKTLFGVHVASDDNRDHNVTAYDDSRFTTASSVVL